MNNQKHTNFPSSTVFRIDFSKFNDNAIPPLLINFNPEYLKIVSGAYTNIDITHDATLLIPFVEDSDYLTLRSSFLNINGIKISDLQTVTEKVEYIPTLKMLMFEMLPAYSISSIYVGKYGNSYSTTTTTTTTTSSTTTSSTSTTSTTSTTTTTTTSTTTTTTTTITTSTTTSTTSTTTTTLGSLGIGTMVVGSTFTIQ